VAENKTSTPFDILKTIGKIYSLYHNKQLFSPPGKFLYDEKYGNTGSKSWRDLSRAYR